MGIHPVLLLSWATFTMDSLLWLAIEVSHLCTIWQREQEVSARKQQLAKGQNEDCRWDKLDYDWCYAKYLFNVWKLGNNNNSNGWTMFYPLLINYWWHLIQERDIRRQCSCNIKKDKKWLLWHQGTPSLCDKYLKVREMIAPRTNTLSTTGFHCVSFCWNHSSLWIVSIIVSGDGNTDAPKNTSWH